MPHKQQVLPNQVIHKEKKMAELKHVGRMISTNKKVLIAYRTLPGDAFHALVIPTENLSDEQHDSLIRTVESAAGQEAYEFAEALARTYFPDGSIMLAALHTQGKLVRVGTDEVEVTPSTNSSIPLSELNQVIAEQRGVSVSDLALQTPDKKEDTNVEINEVATVQDVPSPTTETADVDEEISEDDIIAISDVESRAKKYRSEADRLSKLAAKYRREAEALVSTKKPTATA